MEDRDAAHDQDGLKIEPLAMSPVSTDEITEASVRDYVSKASLPPVPDVPNAEAVDPLATVAGRPSAFVNAGALETFVAGVSGLQREDALNTALFAQLVASNRYDRNNNPREWYTEFTNSVSKLAWVGQASQIIDINLTSAGFNMDKIVIEVLGALLMGNEKLALMRALEALKRLPQEGNQLKIFERNTHTVNAGGVLFPVCSVSAGVLMLKVGFFTFNATREVTRLLWFTFSRSNSRMARGTMTFSQNEAVFRQIRQDLKNRLVNYTRKYIAEVPLPPA